MNLSVNERFEIFRLKLAAIVYFGIPMVSSFSSFQG